MNIRYVEKRGTLEGLPIILQGIVDDNNDVEALRVCDEDGTCYSWALSDHNISQFKKILKSQIEGSYLT